MFYVARVVCISCNEARVLFRTVSSHASCCFVVGEGKRVGEEKERGEKRGIKEKKGGGKGKEGGRKRRGEEHHIFYCFAPMPRMA